MFVRVCAFFVCSSLLLLSSLSDQLPWCPPSTRYDVHRFPPRCLACPKITQNSMSISSISTRTVHPRRQRTAKFSPGLPDNQTCGCWKAGNQSVIDVSLNASWVVSGLTFSHMDRTRWLRRFSVSASGDNRTFLDWGVYTQSNFTSASAVLFRYPIRASFFRITVFEYVNHMINASSGFPLRIDALVCDSEPFGCECAALDTGECCPFPNMEVKGNQCVMCMDPSDIHTVVIDGCGRCKPGTRPTNASSLKCIPLVQSSPSRTNFSLEVSSAISNGGGGVDEWKAWIEFSRGAPGVVLFLSDGSLPCTQSVVSSVSACLAPFQTNGNGLIPVLWNLDLRADSILETTTQINPQYVQFDRGRLALVLNESTLRATPGCGATCSLKLGALFLTPARGFSFVDTVLRQVTFDLIKPQDKSLVCTFSRIFVSATVELHHYVDIDQYRLVLSTSNASFIQWDDDGPLVALGADGVLSRPPPAVWFSMRFFSGDQWYSVRPPVPLVKKRSMLSLQFAREDAWVRVAYGFGLKPLPEPGDSEQLVTISAMSKQPMRLARLASSSGGGTTLLLYTTPKGFISDPKRALDLVVACNGMMSANSMVTWLESALGLMGTDVRWFVQKACERVRTGEVSKLYWLVPELPIGTGRKEKVGVKVEAEFA